MSRRNFSTKPHGRRRIGARAAVGVPEGELLLAEQHAEHGGVLVRVGEVFALGVQDLERRVLAELERLLPVGELRPGALHVDELTVDRHLVARGRLARRVVGDLVVLGERLNEGAIRHRRVERAGIPDVIRLVALERLVEHAQVIEVGVAQEDVVDLPLRRVGSRRPRVAVRHAPRGSGGAEHREEVRDQAAAVARGGDPASVVVRTAVEEEVEVVPLHEDREPGADVDHVDAEVPRLGRLLGHVRHRRHALHVIVWARGASGSLVLVAPGP